MQRPALWRSAAFGVLLASLSFAPALADERKKSPYSLKPMGAAELARERGGATANNDQIQTVTNDITATDIQGGNINFAPGAIAHNRLTVSIFNTGNNAVLQAASSFVVNLLP